MKKTFLLFLVLTVIFTFFACGVNSGANTLNTENFEPLGTGENEFYLTVTDTNGNTVGFKVNTDEDIVGKALSSLGIIDGEDGPYGMYIKTVNGQTVDFDRDKKYWAFYIDGEYATAGIDRTEIKNGAIYALKVEK
ncbi:MAG: DUF4430 domain-containing protein [Oscillospiraceae bacterium]|nr:DUF4430 domain-containing protein [Oscillospiraceae bacterium]